MEPYQWILIFLGVWAVVFLLGIPVTSMMSHLTLFIILVGIFYNVLLYVVPVLFGERFM